MTGDKEKSQSENGGACRTSTLRNRAPLRRSKGEAGACQTISSACAKRLDVADELPALRVRKFGPDWHSPADDAVGEKPEERSRSRLLYLRGAEARTLLASLGGFTVTLGAVLGKELRSGSLCIRICCQRVGAGRSFLRRFRQFNVDGIA